MQRVIGLRRSARQHDLSARDRDGLHNQARGRLPEPVPDLVVKGDRLLRGVDMDVIAQAIEELRPVRLRMGLRIHPYMLAIRASSRPVGLGIDVHALIGLPHARQAAQRTQIGERVGGELRLGKNIFRNAAHFSCPFLLI